MPHWLNDSLQLIVAIYALMMGSFVVDRHVWCHSFPLRKKPHWPQLGPPGKLSLEPLLALQHGAEF